MYDYPNNDYRAYLQHSAKGTTWEKKNHKYKYIINGRYVYETEKEGVGRVYKPSENQIDDYIKSKTNSRYNAYVGSDGAYLDPNSKAAREDAKKALTEKFNNDLKKKQRKANFKRKTTDFLRSIGEKLR